MAKVTSGTIVLEVNPIEYRLLMKGLKALATFESLTRDEDEALSALVDDLDGGTHG